MALLLLLEYAAAMVVVAVGAARVVGRFGGGFVNIPFIGCASSDADPMRACQSVPANFQKYV
jgi:hypothetical protein